MVVDALGKISAFFRWSEFLVAFILMGFMTSVPELFVGVSSALGGVANLSLGNLIGANVVNLTLVMGLAAILSRGIKVETSIAKRDAILTLVIVVIVLAMLLDGMLSRVEGAILIFIFFIYLLQLFHANQKRFPYFVVRILQALRFSVNGDKFQRDYEAHNGEKKKVKEIFWDFVKFGIGAVLLLGSAKLIVYLASAVAGSLGLPMVFLGLVILSIGTTLPELTFGIKAVLSGRKEMILGNTFGSVIVNMVFVLGIVALISPIVISAYAVFMGSMVFLIILLIVFATFVRSQGRLSWKEGMVLVLLYVIFLVGEFMMNYAE